jgi:hypothetical protein
MMRALGANELLDVWERGLRLSSNYRALLLLEAALGESMDVLGHLSIGHRDTLLLEMRQATFGPKITSAAHCPACSEQLELNFNVEDIQMPSSIEVQEQMILTVGGYEIVFRLPNSLDMSVLDELEDGVEARNHLLERCVLSVNGRTQNPYMLPPEVVAQISEQMSMVDPQADVELELKCDACAHVWLANFDAPTFFWSELSAWAHRILREVHLLARAYGWREQDILNMSALRRQFYLQMVVGT